MAAEPLKLPSPSEPGADAWPEAVQAILSELKNLRQWLLVNSSAPARHAGSRPETHPSAVVPFPETRYKTRETSPFFENRVQVEHVLKEYFDEGEAADYLRTAPETIRRYVRRKLLPFHQVGRRPVFSRADLDGFMQRQRRASQWPAGPERRTGP